MPSTAVTPLFRSFGCCTVKDESDHFHPASVSGQCRAECLFMAIITLALFLTFSLDLTAGIPFTWLRIILVPVFCFLLPHITMMGIAALIPPKGPVPSLRQAWIFLLLLTLAAVIRFGFGPASDFAPITCTVWLSVAAANVLAMLIPSRS